MEDAEQGISRGPAGLAPVCANAPQCDASRDRVRVVCVFVCAHIYIHDICVALGNSFVFKLSQIVSMLF